MVEGFAAAMHGFSRGFRIIVMGKDQLDLARSLARVSGSVSAISGPVAKHLKQLSYEGVLVLRFPRDGDLILSHAVR